MLYFFHLDISLEKSEPFWYLSIGYIYIPMKHILFALNDMYMQIDVFSSQYRKKLSKSTILMI